MASVTLAACGDKGDGGGTNYGTLTPGMSYDDLVTTVLNAENYSINLSNITHKKTADSADVISKVEYACNFAKDGLLATVATDDGDGGAMHMIAYLETIAEMDYQYSYSKTVSKNVIPEIEISVEKCLAKYSSKSPDFFGISGVFENAISQVLSGIVKTGDVWEIRKDAFDGEAATLSFKEGALSVKIYVGLNSSTTTISNVNSTVIKMPTEFRDIKRADAAWTEFINYGDLVYQLNADGVSYSVNSVNKNVAKYVIEPTINNLPVTIIKNGAFSGRSNMTSISIPCSVTSIGANAFSGCNNLDIINCEAESIPDGWNSAWKGNCKANVFWDIQARKAKI